MQSIKKYFKQLSENQINQLSVMLRLYPEWNARVNVISRKDIDNLEVNHILHSLAIARFVQFTPGTRVIDLGTGGGFPAIPLAMMFPETHFHLVDRIGKKLRVAEDVARQAGIANVTLQHGDIKEVKGTFDFVVVGGGMSGLCAAIAAARLGIKVALIQDRYILGGNNSSEVRVGLGGQINVNPYPSLGYILNEIGPDRYGNARGAHHYQDWKKWDVIASEKNITLFAGYTVDSACTEGGRIVSVTAVEATRQNRIRVCGYTFADCTGDAHLAVMAGARTMMGREARSEYGESLAPEKADGYTMGVSIEWYCEDRNTPCTFPDSLDWGLKLDETTVEPVHRANWYWEVGMNDDQVADAEKIRDYGMYVAYSTFSYCKNRLAKKEDWECTHLVWVSHVSGKRESRRILGDLVLREQDLTRPIPYEDGTCTTTWRIDQHFPDPRNAGKYPGEEWMSVGVLTPIDPYAIPYRCLYSKDIANMFMAGRDISVTHVALGSVRVMRTCAMMGEVVGMAASICTKKGLLPRDIYQTAFQDLVELMKKGTGRTDVPYTQFYHQIDRTGHQAEDR